MTQIQQGNLPNPFTRNQYQDLRRKEGRGRGNLLQEIVERWVPRNAAGQALLTKTRDWPPTYTASIEHLDVSWDVRRLLKEPPRRRRLKRRNT